MLWLLVGIALAVLLPVAAWVLEARVDPVGILTALAVAPLLVLTLLLLDRGQADAGGRAAAPARR